MKGLYIHIPFCNQKCPYCDFFSVVVNKPDHESYFEALLKEIEIYKELYRLEFGTIYFGGGTPSVVPPKVYENFFNSLGGIINLSHLEEITIEINPETYGYEDLKELVKMGFNRFSIGVQSFLEDNLRILGRKHSVKHSLETIENLSKAGTENISIDLIWGLPGQSEEKLKREFEILEKLPVVHLSAYLLTVYEETPLRTLVEKGVFKLPDEEIIERLYYTLLEETEKLGFERYEISNFAKGRKYRSKHNMLYWKLEPFLGIGAGAWSFDGKRRWRNVRNINRYTESLKGGKLPVGEVVHLDERELTKEKLIMGLRTTEGVEKEMLEGKLPEDIKAEFFTERGNRIAFNDKGFLISNALLSMLI